jgi:hypothetical protein
MRSCLAQGQNPPANLGSDFSVRVPVRALLFEGFAFQSALIVRSVHEYESARIPETGNDRRDESRVQIDSAYERSAVRSGEGCPRREG